MKVSALTSLILYVNKLIDSGKYTDITIEDIHEAIKGKRVLRFLKGRAGSDVDLSIHLDSKLMVTSSLITKLNLKISMVGMLGKSAENGVLKTQVYV